jgi:hypothetical protein
MVDDHLVQGVERVDRELLDARAFVGHLVAEGSVFAFLAEHRGRVFLMGSSLICFRRVGAVVDAGAGGGVDSDFADAVGSV